MWPGSLTSLGGNRDAKDWGEGYIRCEIGLFQVNVFYTCINSCTHTHTHTWSLVETCMYSKQKLRSGTFTPERMWNRGRWGKRDWNFGEWGEIRVHGKCCYNLQNFNIAEVIRGKTCIVCCIIFSMRVYCAVLKRCFFGIYFEVITVK